MSREITIRNFDVTTQMPEHALVILCGSRRVGKSLTINTILHELQHKSVTAIGVEHDMERFTSSATTTKHVITNKTEDESDWIGDDVKGVLVLDGILRYKHVSAQVERLVRRKKPVLIFYTFQCTSQVVGNLWSLADIFILFRADNREERKKLFNLVSWAFGDLGFSDFEQVMRTCTVNNKGCMVIVRGGQTIEECVFYLPIPEEYHV